VPPFEYPPGFRQDFMVGMYSHYDKVHPMRTVPKPAMPLILKRAAEEIAPDEDIINLHKALLGKDAVGAIAALRQFNTRDAPPNTRLAYASSETEVLGLVVSRAIHMPLADYLATRIWQKLGAESDAAWAIDATGQEVAYCCFIATLRDWARLGLMLANDGAWNGQDMEDGVQRDIDAFKKTRDDSRS